jgi:hypothetical protein
VTVLELFANPAFTAMLSGLAGLVAGYVSKRIEKAPDVQASLNAAVAGVIAHYTEALRASEASMDAMRGEIRALRETVGELEDHIDLLTTALEKAGVAPPPRRKRAA